MDDLIQRLKPIIVKPGQYIGTGGGEVETYIDVKATLGIPVFMNELASRIWGLMDKNTSHVVGTGVGGGYLLRAISTIYHVKSAYIRLEPRTHGTQQQIEASVPTQEDRVAIVDDVLNTSGTLRRVGEIVRSTGADISGYYVVVRRNEVELDAPLGYLFTTEDFI